MYISSSECIRLCTVRSPVHALAPFLWLCQLQQWPFFFSKRTTSTTSTRHLVSAAVSVWEHNPEVPPAMLTIPPGAPQRLSVAALFYAPRLFLKEAVWTARNKLSQTGSRTQERHQGSRSGYKIKTKIGRPQIVFYFSKPSPQKDRHTVELQHHTMLCFWNIPAEPEGDRTKERRTLSVTEMPNGLKRIPLINISNVRKSSMTGLNSTRLWTRKYVRHNSNNTRARAEKPKIDKCQIVRTVQTQDRTNNKLINSVNQLLCNNPSARGINESSSCLLVLFMGAANFLHCWREWEGLKSFI